MRPIHRHVSLGLALALLSACASPRAGSFTALPTGSATPLAGSVGATNPLASSGTTGVAPTTAPARGSLLTYTAITGTVLAPPGILTNDGAGVVSQGGGNVVSQGGGNVVSQGGGNVLSTAAEVVSQGGGNLVAAGSSRVVSQGGGNVVSQGGGNAVSNNGSALVGSGGSSYRVQAVGANRPLAHAWVVLADADGFPVVNSPVVRTDAAGNYRFPRLPVGRTYHVVALVNTPEGKLGELGTLVRSGEGGGVSDITPATTLAALAFTRGDQGKGVKALGQLDGKAFQTAADTVEKQLVAKPELARDAVDFHKKLDVVAQVEAAVPDLAPQLKEAQQQLAQGGEDPTKLVIEPPVSAVASSAPPVSAFDRAGTVDVAGKDDGSLVDARFDGPAALLVQGNTLFVADRYNDAVRRVNLETHTVLTGRAAMGITSMVALPDGSGLLVGLGSGLGLAGADGATLDDGLRTAFEGVGVAGLAVHGNTLYAIARARAKVVAVTLPAGTQKAGAPRDLPDGGWRVPVALAVDADGVVYVADEGRHALYAVRDADATLLAGGGPGHVDGKLAEARFDRPEGLTFGPDGALYVADAGNHAVRRVDLKAGTVGTVYGGACAVDGSSDQLTEPRALAFTADGHAWVADGNRLVLLDLGLAPAAADHPASGATSAASPDTSATGTATTPAATTAAKP